MCIRDSGMIYDEWGSKQHEILTGTVHRIDPRGTVHLRIGSGSEATEGLMGCLLYTSRCV